VLLARLLGCSRARTRTRADELLHAFGLSDAGARQVKTYSGGMRRRLDIAASPETVPGWLQAVVDEQRSAGQIGWVLVACAAIIAAFAPLTMRLYRTKPAAAAA
jgi:ABC-type polysaccharide/polyol phosphate transport system ATPase subunit